MRDIHFACGLHPNISSGANFNSHVHVLVILAICDNVASEYPCLKSVFCKKYCTCSLTVYYLTYNLFYVQLL